jgi:hypothetical protein
VAASSRSSRFDSCMEHKHKHRLKSDIILVSGDDDKIKSIFHGNGDRNGIFGQKVPVCDLFPVGV